MVTTAVMPLAADYSEAKTFSNVSGSMYPIGKITPDMDYKLVWDTSDQREVTVNDTKISIQPGTVICMLDSFIIRCGVEGANNYMMQSTGLDAPQIYVSVAWKQGVLTVENNAGVLTITSDFTDPDTTDVTKTISFTELYAVYPNGDYVMKSTDQDAFMNSDSEIVAMGITSLDGTPRIIQIVGTIEDPTIEVLNASVTYTPGDIEVDYDSVGSYKDLYKLNKITFTLTNESTSSVTDVNYSYFIVPAEVSADPDNPDTFKNMVRIVPLIALVALVAAAAGMIYFKGKE